MHTPHPSKQLVLRVTGGHQDGKILSIKTQKCLIGMKDLKTRATKTHCAIFRGPHGAAIRTESHPVLVNGTASTVHWLHEGDKIEFPNSEILEIVQLGIPTRTTESPTVFNEVFNDQSDEEATEIEAAEIWMPSVEEDCTLLESPQIDDSTAAERDQEIEEANQLFTASFPSINEFDSADEAQSNNEPAIDDESSSDSNPIVLSIVSNIDNACSDSVDRLDSNFEPTPESVELAPRPTAKDKHLDGIESKFREIHSQNDQTQSRLSLVDDRLTQLSEQIGQLVTLAQDAAPINQAANNADMYQTDATPIDVALNPALQPSTNDAEFNLDTTADDQPTPSFEPTPHSLNEQVESSADFPTDEAPTVTGASADALDALRSAFDEPDEILSEEVLPEEDAIPVAAESVQPANESSSTDENESVADLLARMKSEGQWDGLHSEFDEEQTENPISAEPPVEIAPAEENTEAFEDGNIEDYMSQLLSRMHASSPTTDLLENNVSRPEEPTSETQDSADDSDSESEFNTSPSEDLLNSDDFIPVQKPEKFASLGAMRELANHTARSAMKESNSSRQKNLGYVQLGIAISSFLMSIYYFLIASNSLMDTGFFLGLICVSLSGFMGHRFYTRMKQLELKDVLTTLAKSGDAENQNPRSV